MSVFGARPIGTRAFGDGAPIDPLTIEGEDVFAEISFSANGDMSLATATKIAALLTSNTEFDATVTRAVEWSEILLKASARFSLTLPPVGTDRIARVTDLYGASVLEYENAKPGPITQELNRPDVWSFDLPPTDPKLSAMTEEYVREVQLWRGDRLLTWGPAVRPQISKKEAKVSGKDAMWHLMRRHVGKANRTNYVVNGDFENGLSYWDIGVLSAIEPDSGYSASHRSAQIKTNRQMTGRRSLYLEQLSSTQPKYGFEATQLIFWDVDPANLDGDQWTLVAYAWIDSAKWRNALPGRQGLTLQRSSTVETIDIQAEGGGTTRTFPVSIEENTASIDESTPQDTWVRLEVPMRQPITDDPEIVRFRLACPNGAVYWDRVSLTLDEATRYYETDQTTIIADLVDHLQDPAYDKSDANIAAECPATGIKRDRIYYHSEHPNGFRSIEEFTMLDDGVDISMRYTPTTRTLVTHYPKKGRYLPQYAMELGGNISDFAWTLDGETAASSVIVLGSGNGSDREEASAIDATNFAGGLTLEEVFVAPPDTKIEALENIAAERLHTTSAPYVIAVKTIPFHGGRADPIGILQTGDTIPVVINFGALAISDVYRITRLTINPDDTLELVLNLRELGW